MSNSKASKDFRNEYEYLSIKVTCSRVKVRIKRIKRGMAKQWKMSQAFLVRPKFIRLSKAVKYPNSMIGLN